MHKLLNYLRNIVINNKHLAFIKNSKIGLYFNNLRLNLSYKKYTLAKIKDIECLYDLFSDELSIKTLDMIINQRKKNVVSNNYIKHFNPQYFCFHEMNVQHSDNEIFIDAGAYNGDTLISFLQNVGDNFSEIHCIEPDEYNFKTLLKTIGNTQKPHIYAHNLGVWSESADLGFSNNSSESSKLVKNNSSMVKVNSIDNMFKGKDVTFIKMDVEGAEYKALMGAKEIIKKNKPKLAICVYHKPEDIIDIPRMILEIDDSYRFFLRHHEHNFYETVLYAY